jgi:hypothetical protein
VSRRRVELVGERIAQIRASIERESREREIAINAAAHPFNERIERLSLRLHEATTAQDASLAAIDDERLLTIPEAGRVLGVGRSKAFQLARKHSELMPVQTYPDIGRRVPAALLRQVINKSING